MNVETNALIEIDTLIKLQEGNVQAFDLLYDKYSKLIHFKLLKLVHDKDIAQELHQDVFLRVWEHRTRIDETQFFKGWLLTITKNIVIDFYRKVSLNVKLQEHIIQTATELYDPVSDHINLLETSEWLNEIIDKLPEQRKKVFIQCKLNGRSYEEVAKEFGIGIGTVKDHMAKAMRLLKQDLANQDRSAFLAAIISYILFDQKIL